MMIVTAMKDYYAMTMKFWEFNFLWILGMIDNHSVVNRKIKIMKRIIYICIPILVVVIFICSIHCIELNQVVHQFVQPHFHYTF